MDYYVYLGLQIFLAILGFYMLFVGYQKLREYDNRTNRWAGTKADLYLGSFGMLFGVGVIAFTLLAF